MSLRRPFRESWDERRYKRVARSQSPLDVPRFELIRARSSSPAVDPPLEKLTARSYKRPSYKTLASDDTTHDRDPGSDSSDTDNDRAPGESDLQAKSPDNLDVYTHHNEKEPSRGRRPNRTYNQDLDNIHASSPISMPVVLIAQPPTPQIDLTYATGEVVAPSPCKPDSPKHIKKSNVKCSSSSTLHPSDSISNRGSNTNQPNLSKLANDALEREFTSSNFPIHALRPVPNMLQLMTQIAPTIGDPGSGFTKFGPQSPKKGIFMTSVDGKAPCNDPYQQGLLNDRVIDSDRKDWLQWERKPSPDPLPTRGTHAKPRTTTKEYIASRRTSNAWNGRRYSVDPNLKTSHIGIDVLRGKLNHYELLALDLSVDARRDAHTIGGSVGDIGHSLLADTGRGAGPQGLATDASSKNSVIQQETSSSSLLRPVSILRESSRSRSRERARNSSISTTTMPLSRTSTFAKSRSAATASSSVADSDRIAIGGWDVKERRWRAQDVDSAFDTGRYGSGGIMLWRIVRVTARIEVNGTDTEHFAWYCVPDRALGGWF